MVGVARVESCEYATRVLYTLALERDYREALTGSGAITQLVRQLKGGSECAQAMAASALSMIARMSPELRIQATTQLVSLLSSSSPDVRQRAGNTLRDMTAGKGGEDTATQRAAAMAGGVAPLVSLLKDGLADERVEAQEYSLWSLSMITEATRRATMVEVSMSELLTSAIRLRVCPHACPLCPQACLLCARAHSSEPTRPAPARTAPARASQTCDGAAAPVSVWLPRAQAGVIAPLVQALSAGKLSEVAQAHAATVLACLALDKPNHPEIIRRRGVAPLVALLHEGTLAAKRQAAMGLARLALGAPDTQVGRRARGWQRTPWPTSALPHAAMRTQSCARSHAHAAMRTRSTHSQAPRTLTPLGARDNNTSHLLSPRTGLPPA